MAELDKPKDTWDTPRNILVILAHPDDPEFFCGASIARWVKAGNHVAYCLLTCGDKGTKDLTIGSNELCSLRQKEQRAAAGVLGVDDVRFLNYPDGYLVPDISLRRDITRVIRTIRPDILVTCDPQTLFTANAGLNHPDHRAAGQATLDAVFPSARDHLSFIELWRDEKLEPHVVKEVWVCGTLLPDTILDVTDTWEIKVRALYEHKSQIGEPEKFTERMRARRTADSTDDDPRYEEKFRRLILG